MTTLHEELIAILSARGNAWTLEDELADEVNSRGVYHKGNNSPVEPSQIRLRTREGGSYKHVFERDGRLVRLRVTPSSMKAARASAPRTIRPASQPDGSGVDPSNAVRALHGPRYRIEEARKHVPDQPGLYAIYGDPVAWTELGLGTPTDDRPLYVGKAEDSLLGRDLGDHFSSGKTGSSTLRRSIAALLHDSLGLRGRPRNTSKPDHFDRYGLSPAHDAKLTAWMTSRLAIATWSAGRGAALAGIEADVVRALLPPLNLTLISTEWTADIKARRAVMAAEARGWNGRP